MKRWVRGAMALSVTFSLALGSFALATEAVEAEPVSAPMEEGELLLIAEAYEPDAIVEEGDLPIEEGAPEEPAEGSETGAEAEPGAEAPIFAAIAAGTELWETPEGARIATLAAEGTALVLSQAAEGWFEIAVCTERGIVTGCALDEGLRALDGDAIVEYLDALSARGDVTAYEGDVNRPLTPIACTFEAEEDAVSRETPEQGATEGIENPEVVEGTENPDAVEATESPDAAEGVPEEARDVPEGEAPSEESEAADDTEAAGESETADDTQSAGESETADDTQSAEESETADNTESAGENESVEEPESAGEAEPVENVETREASAAAAESTETASESAVAEQTGDAGSAADAEKLDDAGSAEDTEKTDDAAAYAAAPIGLNQSTVKMGLKERYNGLKATGGSGSVTWSSSNKKIVSVDAATGELRGLKKGSAVITVTSGDGTTASAKVTVKNAPKKIKFKPGKAKMGSNGQTLQLNPRMGKGAASAGISYTSSDAAVATVDGNGLVTSHAAGAAVITATTYNGKKATCKLTVYSVPAPSAIRLPSQMSLGAKETLAQLPVELVPESGATGCTAEITWSSTDKKVVKVDPKTGAIKALKKGKATIVARTANGLKAKCKVTVKKAPKKVTLSATGSAVNVGATVQYSVKLPKGSASSITWSSSDTSVATIDQNGLATGVRAGKVTVTAKTYNGKTATATLTVTGSTKTGDTDSESKVEVPSSVEKLGIASYQNVYSAELSNEQKLEYVIYCAQNQLGKPYKYGYGYTNDSDPSGFDCSGFVYWCFNQAHIKLEQSAYKQGYDDKYTQIRDIDKLKRGDVVCFNTSSDNDLSDHTGIYLGKGYFIHASSGASKRKVVVQRFTGDSISNNYYQSAFSWGRRILK